MNEKVGVLLGIRKRRKCFTSKSLPRTTRLKMSKMKKKLVSVEWFVDVEYIFVLFSLRQDTCGVCTMYASCLFKVLNYYVIPLVKLTSVHTCESHKSCTCFNNIYNSAAANIFHFSYIYQSSFPHTVCLISIPLINNTCCIITSTSTTATIMMLLKKIHCIIQCIS